MRNLALVRGAAFACVICLSPAVAQDDAPGWTVSGSADLLSEWVDRGAQQTAGKASYQGNVALTHDDSGFFVGMFITTVDFGDGTTHNTDAIVGWSGEINGIEASADLQYHTYQNAPPGDSDFIEFHAAASMPLNERIALNGEIFVAPDSPGDTGDATYVAIGPSFTVAEWGDSQSLSIDANIGQNILDPRIGVDYTNWNIGATYEFAVSESNAIALDLRYHDAQSKGCAPQCGQIVGSISFGF